MADDQRSLQVIVRKKDSLVFSGTAQSVSSENEKGIFDILPEHTHFVTTIIRYIKIQQGKIAPIAIPLERALMRVHENKVEVYLFS